MRTRSKKEPLSLRFTRVFYPLGFPLLGLGLWCAALQTLAEGFQTSGAATRNDHLLEAVLLTVAGTVFVILGGMIYKGMKEPEKKRQWLKENGLLVMARVVEIHPVHSLYGEIPYEVICQVEEGGPLRCYKSHYTWVLPPVQEGDWVPVYRDPGDAASYFVDFASNPTAVGER